MAKVATPIALNDFIEREKDELLRKSLVDTTFFEDDLNMEDDLDITTEDLDLENIEDDIKQLKKHKNIAKVFEEGGDLREFSNQNEKELSEVEWGTIQDYISEGETIANLYNQILSCDAVLQSMETLLSRFQSDISNIGIEIKHLQDECLGKEMKIKNRQDVNKHLENFVQGVNIDKTFKENLMKSPMNEAYLELLQTLNKKIAYLETYKFDSQIKACVELEPKMHKLTNEVINRIRKFLLDSIHACKDIELLRKTHKDLIKLGYFYHFMFIHKSDLALEIQNIYRDTSSKVYSRYYKDLASKISKLQYEVANKNDLIGIEEGRSMGLFSGKKQIKDKNIFSLGIRKKLVEDLANATGPVPINITFTEKQPFEFLFHSVVHDLTKSTTDEFRFNQDFFLSELDTISGYDIFGKTLSIFSNHIDHYLTNSYDCIGMLIMIVITQKYRTFLQKSLNSTLDDFLEQIYIQLIERFFAIFELNINSVKNANPKDLVIMDLQPHYITRRYAEFVVSVLYLSGFSEFSGDISLNKKLNTCLTKLREEIEKVLIRMAEAKHKDWRSKTIFLMNNYDLILSVFAERDISSLDSVQFQKLLDIKTNDLAQDHLNKSFPKLITFAKDYGALAKAEVENNDAQESISKKEAEIENLLTEFQQKWKTELEAINSNMITSFSNLKNGMRVFKKVVEELLDAYGILYKIIKKYFKALRVNNKNFIPETVIQAEVKKFFIQYE